MTTGIRTTIFTSVGILIITLFLLNIVYFIFPDMFVEMGILVGLVVTEIVGPIVIFILMFIFKRYLRIGLFKRGAIIFLSFFLLPYFFWLENSNVNIHKYFTDLANNRTEYRSAAETDIIPPATSVIKQKIEEKLPSQWRLNFIGKTDNSSLFWFTAVQPSPIYGSIGYMGYYDQQNIKVIALTKYDDLWIRVQHNEHVPKDVLLSNVSPFLEENTVDFITNSTLNRTYYGTYTVYLSISNNQLVVRKIEFKQ